MYCLHKWLNPSLYSLIVVLKIEEASSLSKRKVQTVGIDYDW